MSQWRENDKGSLSGSSFDESPETVDSLPIKWPHNAELIDDPNWFEVDEQAVVPLTNRLIKADHFNYYADAICALEYYLRDHQGQAWLIDADGNTTPCSSAANLPRITGSMLSSAIFQGSGLILAVQSVTVTGVSLNMISSGLAPYNYQYTGTIPSVFGTNPWSALNFSITHSVEIQSASGKGLWANLPDGGVGGKGITAAINTTPFIWGMVTPVSGSLTGFQCSLRIMNTTPIVSGSDGGDAWSSPWYPVDAYNTWTTDYIWAGNAPFGAMIGPTFVNRPSGDTFPMYRAATGNAGWHRFDWRWGGTAALSLCEIGTPFSGYGGGMVYILREYNNMSLVYDLDSASADLNDSQDVGIEFGLHSWFTGHWDFQIGGGQQGGIFRHLLTPSASGYGIKGGVFLRLQHLTGGLRKSFDSRHPQYSGYLLRFGAQPSSGQTGANDYKSLHKDNVGSWAIMKVRYESFCGAQLIPNFDDSHYFWYDDTNGRSKPATGTWFTSAEVPGEYQVLAYGSEIIEPQMVWTMTNGYIASGGLNYRYRFQMVGSVISLLKQTTTNGPWTTIFSMTDPSPLSLVVNQSHYYPGGLFAKTSFGSYQPLSQVPQSGYKLVFSNPIVYSVASAPTSGGIDLGTSSIKMTFLMSKISGHDTEPPLQ